MQSTLHFLRRLRNFLNNRVKFVLTYAERRFVPLLHVLLYARRLPIKATVHTKLVRHILHRIIRFAFFGFLRMRKQIDIAIDCFDFVNNLYIATIILLADFACGLHIAEVWQILECLDLCLKL